VVQSSRSTRGGSSAGESILIEDQVARTDEDLVLSEHRADPAGQYERVLVLVMMAMNWASSCFGLEQVLDNCKPASGFLTFDQKPIRNVAEAT
jgi:hypothetical protein